MEETQNQEKHFIQDILKVLLLSKQEVSGQYGVQETQSIFEAILSDIKDKFKIDEKLVNELQVEFAQYVKENKERIIEKSSEILAEKVAKIDSYDFKNMIGGSDRLCEIIEKQIIDNPEIEKTINEIVYRDFPGLARKIKEGRVEIEVKVNLK